MTLQTVGSTSARTVVSTRQFFSIRAFLFCPHRTPRLMLTFLLQFIYFLETGRQSGWPMYIETNGRLDPTDNARTEAAIQKMIANGVGQDDLAPRRVIRTARGFTGLYDSMQRIYEYADQQANRQGAPASARQPSTNGGRSSYSSAMKSTRCARVPASPSYVTSSEQSSRTTKDTPSTTSPVAGNTTLLLSKTRP